MPPKRQWLTLRQKYEILVQHRRFPSQSKEQLAVWAQKEFRLPCAPSHGVIRATLKAADEIETELRNAPTGSGKRRSPVQCPQLEEQLMQYVDECKQSGEFLSRQKLTEKAAQILENIPDAPEMRLSDGWLARFMKRQRLGFRGNEEVQPSSFVPLAEITPEEEVEAQTERRRPPRAANRIVATVVSVPPVVTVYEPPHTLISEMVGEGAEWEPDGRSGGVVRIDGVHASAWKLCLKWACSPGVVGPLVQAVFAPTQEMHLARTCPPHTLGISIQNEANSIVRHMAELSIRDFADGIPALPPAHVTPPRLTSVQDAKVAVTALLPAISNPGGHYPVIDALRAGQYICNVDFTWRGTIITVPIIRLRY